MLTEIKDLYRQTVTYFPMVIFPCHVKNKVMPKVKQLQLHEYKEDLKPIRHTLEKLTAVALLLTKTAANTYFFGLIFEIATFIKGGIEICRLVKEMKKLADEACKKDQVSPS